MLDHWERDTFPEIKHRTNIASRRATEPMHAHVSYEREEGERAGEDGEGGHERGTKIKCTIFFRVSL